MSDSTASGHKASATSHVADGAQRFVLLDGLRGVAAFAVILDHVPGGVLGDLLPGRYLAVDFFFVLSGFVLAHAYSRRLEQGWSPLSFMTARLIRLYPMYLLGLALGLALSVIGLLRGWVGPTWSDVLTTAGLGLLFLPAPPMAGFGGGALYPFNGPAWSLFFELIANLVYALVARFLSWRVLGAVLVVGAVAVVFTINRHAGTGGPGWLWEHFDAGLARVMFDFFAGVTIHRVWAGKRLPALPWWAALLAFLLVIAVPAEGMWRIVYDSAAALILMPTLVALSAGSRVTGSVARLCSTIGLLSYGVYVIHVPLFATLGGAAAAAHVQLGGGPWLAVLVAALAAVLAAISYVAFDRPLRVWLSARAREANVRNTPGERG
jgi:peptidoglycan/LPS O-acetylase OafA/YrhL